MKELSTEQKAKAYDEALEKARIWKNKSGMPKDKQGILDDIFPELRENEDEKTKKTLHSISSKMSFHLRDIFTEEEFQCFDAWSNAWLENKTKERLNESEWNRDDEQYLLICKNALAKYQVTDKWDANIIYNWLKNKLQKNYDTREKSQTL